jgi:hypothetical protein
LNENIFFAVEQQLDFVLNLLRRLPGFRIQAKPSGKIQCIPSKNCVAKGRLNALARQVNGLACSLWRGLRKCALYCGKDS